MLLVLKEYKLIKQSHCLLAQIHISRFQNLQASLVVISILYSCAPLSIFNTYRDHCTAAQEICNVALQGLRQREYLFSALSYLFISIWQEFLFCFYQLALVYTQRATHKMKEDAACNMNREPCSYLWRHHSTMRPILLSHPDAPDIIVKLWYQSWHTVCC